MAVTLAIWGQDMGSISGKVTDRSGQSVPDAVIVITEATRGESQRVVVSGDGTFTIARLRPGIYFVDVESGGATIRGAENITVIAGRTAEVAIRYDAQAGRMGSVAIQATTTTLQTDSAEVARSYESRTIRSLPLLDRQHQELITLMPGITPPQIDGDRINNPQRARTFQVNGQPDYANLHNQDGVYNQEPYSLQPIRVAPNASVQALNVRTSNYNAAYGRSGGSWANLLTPSGAHGVHGSIFGFNTNHFFRTRHPLNPEGNPDPRFNINQFGGSLGGPIAENRLFFFGSYEGYKQRGRQLDFATVPTQAMRNGDFSQFSNATLYDPRTGAQTSDRVAFFNNRIPQGRITPFASAVMNQLPLPNRSGLGNNLFGNPLLQDDNHRVDGKMDARFTDNTTGSFRYGFTHGDVQRESLLGPIGNSAQSQLRNHTAVVNIASGLTDSTLTEFRVGFNRFRNQVGPWGNMGTFGDNLGNFGFSQGLPEISISGIGTLGFAGNIPGKMVTNALNTSSNWSSHSDRHRLRYGIDVVHLRSSGWDPGFFSPRGSFQFGPGATSRPGGMNQFDAFANSWAAFLLGSPTQAGSSQFTETPTYQQTLIAGYITDTINLADTLYLELGVRYDLFTPLRTRRGVNLTFDPSGNQITRGLLEDYDWNNFAPRVGLAFRPAERVVFRGGYGLLYFPTPYSMSALNQSAQATQMGTTGAFSTVNFSIPQPALTGPGAGALANQPLFYNPGDPRTPYIQSFNAMIQADLGAQTLFDIGYVGALGRNLPSSRLLGGPAGSGVSGLPFANLGRSAMTFERSNSLSSNYNALQVNLTKQFSYGLAISGAYTWSKALDYGFEQLNPRTRQANYGPADWDRTHMLTMSHVWRLPFGRGHDYFNTGWAGEVFGNWELNGILRWATGTPYSITADPLFCACPGLSAVRVDVAGNPNLSGNAGFNPSQFRIPQNSFGELGRNPFRGPEFFTYDLSLFRNFSMGEAAKLELRAEAFNVTNSTNLANPVANLTSPNAGRAVSLMGNRAGRQFQVGARIVF